MMLISIKTIYLLMDGLAEGSLGKTLEVVDKRTAVVDVLDVGTIGLDSASLAGLLVLGTGELGEAPLVRDQELLATSKLVLGATEGLQDDGLVGILGADRDKGLANGDTGSSAVGLTKGSTHTGLKTIGTSTTQHLVDTQDVEGMDTDTHVEAVLAQVLGDVLVGTDTGGFQGLGADLLDLVGEQVDAEGELLGAGLLAAEIENLDLWIRDTAAETRLGVGLVLAVAVATRWTTTHF